MGAPKLSIVCACLLTLAAVAVPVQAADPPPFVFSHNGAAGDWLVLNMPLANEVDDFEWQQEYRITATAPLDRVGHLLVFPLDILSDTDSFPAARFDPPVHHTIPAGETATFEDAGHRGASISGGTWRSLAIAVASDVPFTFDLLIDPDDGYPALDAPRVNAGTGTSVQRAEELFDASVAPANEIHLEGTFATAGWHHVQLDFDYVQPDGFRTYDIRFPTVSWEGEGRITGVDAGVVGSAGSSGMLDMMGSYTDTAGDFSIDLSHVQASWDLDVFVYEMPGSFALPPDWTATYQAPKWPFWDCLSCPPLPDP